jgi:hypothetical protein
MELEFYIEVPMSNTTGDDEKGISIKGGDSDSRIGSWGGGSHMASREQGDGVEVSEVYSGVCYSRRGSVVATWEGKSPKSSPGPMKSPKAFLE